MPWVNRSPRGFSECTCDLKARWRETQCSTKQTGVCVNMGAESTLGQEACSQNILIQVHAMILRPVISDSTAWWRTQETWGVGGEESRKMQPEEEMSVNSTLPNDSLKQRVQPMLKRLHPANNSAIQIPSIHIKYTQTAPRTQSRPL